MKLTWQHVRILEELSFHHSLTREQLGLRSRRALQTLNGHGLIWNSGPEHAERWHITSDGCQALQDVDAKRLLDERLRSVLGW